MSTSSPINANFLEDVWSDIQEGVIAVAKSRAKRPRPWRYVITVLTNHGVKTIAIEIRVLPTEEPTP